MLRTSARSIRHSAYERAHRSGLALAASHTPRRHTAVESSGTATPRAAGGPSWLASVGPLAADTTGRRSDAGGIKGGDMLLAPANATTVEIQDELTRLRTKQRRAVIASTRDELDAEMAPLLDELGRRTCGS